MQQKNGRGRGIRARCVAASPDCFFTGSVDGTVNVWDAASGTWKARLTGHHVGLPVLGLAVSSQKQLLFSGALHDPHLHCWDVEHGRVIRSYGVGQSGVRRLAFDPSRNILVASVHAEEVCLVFDMRAPSAGGAPVLILISSPPAARASAVLSILALPSQPQVVTGSSDSTIKLWDLARPASPISTLSSHHRAVHALAMVPSQQGRVFASASTPAIRTFTLSEGHPRPVLSMRPGSIGLAINGGDVMACARFDGTLCFWDCNTGNKLQHVSPLYGKADDYPEVEALSFDTTGTRLVTCERNGAITMWKQTVTI